jgi:hypothetical protein
VNTNLSSLDDRNVGSAYVTRSLFVIMSIQNLNGGTRKNGRITTGATSTTGFKVQSNGPVAMPTHGADVSNFQHGKSIVQHVAVGVPGTSYQSPFTNSAIPPMGTHFNNATLPQLVATKVESPGVVKPLNTVKRVPPHEKGATFVQKETIKVTSPKFSPSITNDVPSNPNKPAPPLQRPVRHPHVPTEKVSTTHGSFLGSKHTLTSHAANDPSAEAGGGMTKSRWSTLKQGAVQ